MKKEVKDEEIENNNKPKEENITENKEQEHVTQKPNKEKRCIKCNNLLSEDDKFCFICGTNQETKRMPKEKIKTPSNKNMKSLIILIVIIIIGIWATLFLISYLDNSQNNINTSNKNVTVDDTGIADAVEKVYDSVVVVENYVNGSLYATGSGFVYKTDNSYGYILTNSHVITNATSIKLGFTNDKKAEAEIVGTDEYSDVAVLKVAKKYIVQVAEIGNNNKMRVGDTTFAVGTPLDAKAVT